MIGKVPVPNNLVLGCVVTLYSFECQVFNEKWKEHYFFVEANNGTASFLMCNKSVAVLKEYSSWAL